MIGFSQRQLVLSLDIGTSTLKVGVFDLDGNLVHVESREQELILLSDNRVEQSLAETWEKITDAVKVTLAVNEVYRNIAAISVSVQRGSVIPLDQHGNPLSNQIVWMDKRGLPYVEMVNRLIGKERYYYTAGHSLSYITGASKVLWYQHAGGDLWEEASVIGTPQTFFLHRLGSDGLVCDHSSGTYHFPFNIEKKDWSKEIAADLGFPLEKLPKVVRSTDIVGHLSKSSAEELSLEEGIPIVAGGGDGQCAAAGCGAIVPGICMINIGTATGVQIYLERPTRNPGMIFTCSGHVVPDAWESEGHTQASGTVFRWFRDEFGMMETICAQKQNEDVYDYLINEAIQTPPGAEGLLFIPTFNGTTGPVSEPLAKGCLVGLSLRHKKQHIIRALLEGITMEIRWMLESISKSGASIQEIRLSAGGSKNPHWNQIHANILGRPVSTVLNRDAGLVGAAMCAAVGIGAYDTLIDASEKFVKLKEKFYPQEGTKIIYDLMYDEYLKTFNTLRETRLFDSLDERSSLM
jgi:xylulokinase